VGWNLFRRRDDELVDCVFEVLDRFDLGTDIDLSVRRRTVEIVGNVLAAPPGLDDALRSAVGPRFRVRFIADPGFVSPIGATRVWGREATDDEKQMLLEKAAGTDSEFPPTVRDEIASRLRAGEGRDSIIAWLSETMGWRGGD
jgi:hypothetical protein